VRYLSTSGTRIPLSNDTTRTVLAGQPSVTYDTSVDGQHVRVEALPIRAPVHGVSGNTNGVPMGNGPVIGVLLVAKSLSDVVATLLLLRVLLLISGVATLVGTLIASWIIATRALRPLSELVTTARSIAASTARGTRLGNLSQRVPRPRGRDEMVQVVETFNEMLASLESATQAQRRFVADASHELRAPLTTIQGNLAFLQRHLDELPPEERRTTLADAYEETLRLAELAEDLLLLARADAGVETPPEVDTLATVVESSMRKTPLVELDHTVLQLVRQLRRRLSMEGSTLKLEIGPISPVRVRGDEESLRRVALILLDNALKYTPSSSEDGMGRVIVSLERIKEQAVLRVRDTGIGIDPADVPHLFERFERADRARSRQGTGLGLSIAQTLVEQLGGRITAESTPGKGSTFSIWLPLA
jgi:two-component system OmpR family sensor kinase